jgi:hypothetical protein
LLAVTRTPVSILAFVLAILRATISPITHTVTAAFPRLLTVFYTVGSGLVSISPAVLTQVYAFVYPHPLGSGVLRYRE